MRPSATSPRSGSRGCTCSRTRRPGCTGGGSASSPTGVRRGSEAGQGPRARCDGVAAGPQRRARDARARGGRPVVLDRE
jgi:hypothetical protein